jgi:hypothetical protein
MGRIGVARLNRSALPQNAFAARFCHEFIADYHNYLVPTQKMIYCADYSRAKLGRFDAIAAYCCI